MDSESASECGVALRAGPLGGAGVLVANGANSLYPWLEGGGATNLSAAVAARERPGTELSPDARDLEQ